MSHYDMNCSDCDYHLSEVIEDGFWKIHWHVCTNLDCKSFEVKMYVADCNFCDNKVKLQKNSLEGLKVSCFECSIEYSKKLK